MSDVDNRRLPLSAAQRGIWFAQQLDPANPTYDNAQYLDIRGPVNIGLLREAVRRTVLEVDSCHCRFTEDADGVWQTVVRDHDWAPEIVHTEEPHAWMREQLTETFDLAGGPLISFAILPVDAGRTLLYLRTHHLVTDGFGGALLVRRITEIYTALENGTDYPPTESGSLQRVLEDDAAYQSSEQYTKDREFWRNELRDLPEFTGRHAPASHTFLRHTHHLAAETAASLRRLARECRVGLSAVLIAALGVQLHRATGETDLMIGLPVPARKGSAVRDTILMMANELPLRLRARPETTVRELAAHAAGQARKLLQHQRYRNDWVQRDLGALGARLYGPVINIMSFDYDLPMGNCTMTVHNLSNSAVEDLGISVYDNADGSLRIDFNANPALYSPDDNLATLHRFVTVLDSMARNPDRAIGCVDVITAEEETHALERAQGTRSELPAVTVPELFEAQVARTPHALALVCGDAQLSYQDLNDQADALARHLAALGAGPERVVALMLPRDADFVVAMLAVFKTGAAYVPIDPDLPADRIAFLLGDTDPVVTLTELPETLQPGEVRGPAPENPAYVIYTSGSTGTPKGVVVPHRALTALFHAHQEQLFGPHVGPVAVTASFSFDTSLDGLLWMIAGHPLHVPTDDVRRDPRAVVDYVREHGIDFLDVTPSYADQLVAAGLLDGRAPSVLMLGGEPVPANLWNRLRDHGITAHNYYGPTETTIDATSIPVHDSEQPAIGRPLPNLTTHVLDRGLRPVPRGVAGELYIAGPQLARGYLNRPGLTAQRFVACPFGNGRMYRTGDLARWNDNDQLEYLGRTDDQVKVRGFRIELGEIEAAIPGQAAVVVRNDRLIAYVVGDTSGLREHLAATLPSHMVPAAIVELDALPLTRNGKLDRSALPDPEYIAQSQAPRTPQEQVLCELFAEVLGLDQVGVDDGFFDLGGHSLLATRLVSRIRTVLGVEVPIRFVFEAPTVRALTGLLGNTGTARPALTARQRPERLELSFAQRRLWFLNRFEDNATYHMPLLLRLSGELDREALQAALKDVVRRHEALRTRYPEIDGRPHQIVTDDYPVLSEMDSVEEAAAKGFDLANELPIRASLSSTSPTEHALLLLVHHIAGDGWSLAPLARDLSEAYQARLAGMSPDWTPLPVQYADYTLWQHELLGAEEDPDSVAAQQIRYWREQLADLPDEIALPARPRPAETNNQGAAITVDLDDAKLAKLAHDTGTTRFMIMHAAVSALLTRLGAGTDIPLGSPIAGRTDEALDDLVGFFVNTLVIRTSTAGNPTFRELLNRVRDTILNAHAHQDLPFERLVEILNPPRSLARHPLFQVMLAVENDGDANIALPGLDATVVPVDLGTTPFDLSITVDGPACTVQYRTDLFDHDTTRSILDRLVRLLDVVTANPDLPIGHADILTDGERQQVSDNSSGPRHDLPSTTLPQLFELQAARTPHAEAVVCADTRLSYQDLNERANRLAHRLIEQGAGPEQVVALRLDRSADQVVALLAVLKTGAAYLPVDTDLPADRIDFLLRDAAPAHVLTEIGDLTPYPATNPDVVIDPSSAAYVIYTSGSTGRPKGVVVEHRGVINLLHNHHNTLVTPDDIPFALTASFSFDTSWEGLLWMFAGHPLHVLTDEVRRDAQAVVDYVRANDIGVLDVPASYAEQLLSVGLLDSPLKVLMLGGEAVGAALWRELREHPETISYNYYGPTEATVDTVALALRDSVQPVIGRPLRNTTVHVLDDNLRHVPPGVPGELYLTGAQLARGYLNRPGLTAQRFPANPFGNGRMYRTGDLVRWNDRGHLEYLGRTDDQVKIRGYRVELGEIEAAIPGQAAVIVRNDRLIAYVVGDTSGLREHLAATLPSHMVPAAIVELDALPLTRNGKLDRAALPEPEFTTEGQAPRTPREQVLCQVFSEVLNVERVGIDDGFFDLGGHSLLATRLVSRIRTTLHAEVSVRAIFDTPTVRGLAAALDDTPARPALTPAERPERIPLSSAQQRLWFLNRLGDDAAYNMALVLRLSGELHVAALEAALNDVVARHETLRTRYPDVDGTPYQLIGTDIVQLSLVDDLDEIVTKRFDLATEPPIRFALTTTSPTEHALLLVVHHIAGDGWSVAPLAEDLSAAYTARLAGTAPAWTPLPVQYADYALWQRGVLGDEHDPDSVAAQQVRYWREQLADLPDELNLPSRPRPAHPGSRGALIPIDLGAQRYGRIEALARTTGTTVFMIVQAAVATLLTRHGAGTDIPLGTPIAGRTDEALDDLIGCFVNTLVLRTDTSGNPTFRELLARVRDTTLDAHAHQDLPFERLVEILNPPRTPSRHPLFQVMLTMDNTADGIPNLPGLDVTAEGKVVDAAKFDLSITLRDGEGWIEYRTDLFDHDMVESLLARLVRLLDAATADPDARIFGVDLLTADERTDTLARSRGPQRPVPAATVVDLFEAQVARTPDAIALVHNQESLSYQDLNARANRLARSLVAKGAGPERLVALLMSNSADAVVACLAVLKTGAAYLPIDPDAPAERIEYTLADAAPVCVLTSADTDEQDASELKTHIDPSTPAYVIYTSGSTGRPKGVVVEHRSVVDYLTWCADAYPAATGRTLVHSPITFDLTVTGLYTTLTTGGCVELGKIDDAGEEIAFLKATPSHLPLLTAYRSPTDLLILGGEQLRGEALTEWRAQHPGVTVINAYGPTEATVNVTQYTVPDVVAPGPVPIGTPFPNTAVYVLDEALNLAPAGVTGELYLAGAALARGYLNQPGLTAQRFVACPFSESRMYRTGDLARWNHDGQLEFVGRADDQVKIRGFRVELGEIEAAIPGHAAVIVRDDRLIAYVVGETEGLRQRLADRLPSHMVPAAFVRLDALPLTRNGKLDRKALPDPEYTARGRGPRTPREQILCRLFAEVLGIDHVGVDDDFFDLGGHSLLATRLVSRIRTTLKVEVPLRAVFERPTVEGLAKLVLDTARPALVPANRPERLPLSYAQQRLWFLNRLDNDATYNMPLFVRLSGELDRDALQEALADVVRRHESLRTLFPDVDGKPYQLIVDDVPRLSFVDTIDLAKDAAEAANTGFDLAAELPIRATLFATGPAEHALLLLVHHIAGDGWSLAPLARDLAHAYTARRDGTAPDWAPLPVQYADYTLWQREVLGTENDPESLLSQQIRYWRAQLADLPDELALPTDRPRPAEASNESATVTVEVHAKLAELARDTGTTVFMVVQAAVSALLTRLGAGTDIPLGTPIAGRTDEALDDLVGFFVNTLVLRTNTQGNPTFRELLTRVREIDLAAYAHQDLPFERLVDVLNPARSQTRHPLFQVMLVVQNFARPELELPGLDVGAPLLPANTTPFDLMFRLEGTALDVQYRTDLFDQDTVRSIADRLVRLLDTVAADPDVPFGAVELLTPAERAGLLTWSAGRPLAPLGVTLPALLEAQAARTPHAVAVRCGAAELSYAELNARANRLARWLIAHGAGPDRLVAVSLPRTAELLVALLAVLKSGSAYLPLDPEYPAERIDYMLADAAPAHVLTALAETGEYSDSDVTDADRISPLTPAHAAYAIYTSGSTGRPKGVVITHDSVVDLLRWAVEDFGPDRLRKVLATASLNFDPSVFELFAPLACGGTVELVRDLLALTELPGGRWRGSMILALPSAWSRVLAHGGVTIAADDVVFGGEGLTLPTARMIRTAVGATRITNAYGPTEACMTATAWYGEDAVTHAPPIGGPLPGKRTYVLDGDLQLVPRGVPGELYIAGSGLARGYLHRPALTAERFVACPFERGRMYRTGDVVRWNASGDLEYLGRADDQVKIRGFRIEPGEVEAALIGHDHVQRAAVVVREDRPGDRRLVGYVVTSKPCAPTELRDFAAARLPVHLVPSAIVVLDDFPLSPNGKLDQRALPAPEFEIVAEAPRTPREELVCRLFADVLGLPAVSPRDGFFALGGDSILAIQLVSRARKAGVHFTPRDVFAYQTPAALARVREQEVLVERDDPIGPVPATPIMRWLADIGGPADHFHQSVLLVVPPGIRKEHLVGALQAVLDHHDILRSRTTEDGLEVLPRGAVRAEDVLRRVPRLDRELAEETKKALDPAGGAMIRALWVDAGPEHPGRLLLCAHHFAVDGVSWRILLPDLLAAHDALAAGAVPELEPVGTSFRTWVAQQVAVAAKRGAELQVWQHEDAPLIARPLDPAVDVAATARRLTLTLPAAVTTPLLTTVPAACHARVTDVLIAALALAVAGWRRTTDVLLEVEGHGREDIGTGADLSRTVGWFTSVYPVRLDVATAPGNVLKHVKEQLRALPDNGIGYGMLRYLNPDTAEVLAAQPRPQIGFNYLGRVGSSMSGWDIADEDDVLADGADERMPLPHVIAVNASTVDGELSATWTWAGEVLTEAAARDLAERWFRALELLAEQPGGGHTPSDFPLTAVTQRDIDRFETSPHGMADVLPLAPLQEGLLFHSLYDQDSPDVYLLHMVLELEGPLDAAALRAAGQGLLDRHANLRVSFEQTEAGDPVQVVAEHVALPWREIDLTGQPDSEWERVVRETRTQRLDLSEPPLLRGTLVRLAPDRHRFLLSAHHILLDGWSMPVLLTELFTLYGRKNSLPAVTPYRDYLVWLAGQDHELARAAWTRSLAGLEEPTRITRTAPGLVPVAGQRVIVEASEELTDALTALARKLGVTLNTVLQCAWGLLLASLTGRDDVVFGATVSGRPAQLAGAETMLGLFINTLPVRMRIRPGDSVAALLRRVQEEQSELLPHHHFPLARLHRITGLTELFDTTMVFENYPLDSEALEEAITGIHVTDAHGFDSNHYPLNLTVMPDKRLGLKLGYQPTLLDHETVTAHAHRLLAVLAAFVADPERSARGVELFAPGERDRLLAASRGPVRAVPDSTLPALFEAQVERTPDAIALIVGDTQLSYQDLNRRANRLAHHLIGRGVGPDQLVALRLPRSADLVVACLAVLKAGAAYLPIEADHPADRIAFTLADAQPVLVLDSVAGAGGPDTNPAVEFSSHTAAYVIYTSGSTGRPKGVVVSHHNVVNYLAWCLEAYPGVRDSALVHSPVSFDLTVTGLYAPLISGGTVHLGELAEGAYSFIKATPSHLPLLTALPERCSPTGQLVLGGEPLPGDQLDAWRRLHPAVAVVNEYGPTETTVGCSEFRIEPGAEIPRSVLPLGLPIWNTDMFVLGDRLTPRPAGVTGELYIAGHQLARGYLNRPGLTAERFVANPFGGPGERMYRTGDLARWTVSGELEFAGRVDHQVKIRGYRVELGEIEATLAAHPAVAQAVVIVRDDRLIAYVVLGEALDPLLLKDFVTDRLPEYMVPSAFVELDELPLTRNAKLDKDALPAPGVTVSGRAPRSPREQILAQLFAEALGLDEVGIDDDFFALGGHSLIATKLVSRIRTVMQAELPIRAVFEHPTVSRLFALLDETTIARPTLVPVERPERVPLSFAQQRLWFLKRFETNESTYNMPIFLRLSGPIDADALQAALADVVGRHESLRTLYREEDGRPYQLVVPASPVLSTMDVSSHELDRVVAKIAAAGFDLAEELPIRATLFALGDDEFALLLLVHHIAGDGWSLAPLARDLSQAYTARLGGTAPEWESLPVQYADYSLWQRDVLGDENDPESLLSQQIQYWRAQLADLPDELALPTDRPRPAVATHHGATVTTELPQELRKKLAALARGTGTTEFMIMHAALATLLTRLGAGTDIPIGSPVAGRTDSTLDDLVGFFVNTLVLRTNTAGDPAFRDLLAGVRETHLSAHANQDLPFDRLVELLNPRRSLARHPLFQVMLVVQNYADGALDLPGVEVGSCEPVRLDTTKFDLTFTLDGTSLDLQYRTDLFDQGTARSILDRLVRVLTAVTAHPDRPIGHIDVLTTDERQSLLAHGRGPVCAGPPATLPALFRAQVARTPDATAVICGNARLSYQDLYDRANRLAHWLIARGAGPERIVAVMLPRSADAVVAQLAIAFAGAAYLPIDPDYPRERIDFLLQDAAPRVLLTELPELSGPVAPPVTTLCPSHPAYVIYTSGSTGRPKGVVVSHAGLTNLARAQATTLGVRPDSRVLRFASASFDASIWELAMTLLTGATLVVAPADQVLPGAPLAELAARQEITHATLPPAALAVMSPDDLPSVTTLVVAGEASSAELVGKWSQGRTLFNAYGPTETTVCATISAPLTEAVPPPIGRPLANTGVYVLDSALRLLPPGVTGELYVSGAQLARGYLARPGLTAQRFVACPFEPGRMYRTGDLARWDTAGQLHFVGRADDQVKIRGFRIEPGEIEAAIPGQAAVIVRDDRLVAYVVGETEGLRERLAASLPGHMVPAAIVSLDAFPLTPNGKLDRRALPAPEYASTGREPRTPQEHELCRLFAETLGRPSVTIDDDFFDLGGHSLLAMGLLSRIRDELGTEVSIRSLFATPTVAGLVGFLGTGGRDDALAVVQPLRVQGNRPPLFCLPPAGGMSWSYAGLLRHLDLDQPVYGLQAAGLSDPAAVPSSVEDDVLMYLHHIQRIQPTGPYQLLGWSYGGLLAHGIAVELQRRGKEVALVALLDSYPHDGPFEETPPEGVLEALLEAVGVPAATDVTTATALLREHGGFPWEVEESDVAAFVATYQRSSRLAQHHTPGLFDGDIQLFTARGSTRSDAWRHHVTGEIHSHAIDASHHHMTRPEPLARIGAVLLGATCSR
ncbi:hypothetical protein Lesp02_13720 [Lentzea sp. NBRC 105346]|uniref:non-ribosomal peptide synthase/polyketide synthase n=1 Tax=Lentzea sp. NBRC 105346 TaxID=3032205 RepID=UPI0024A01427|nr:non-ribosomal peptide synthase/polyketide synthase [Lentzea sp. NBRC 105346]GLZ29182.1 hypothetical protein Lesp02_13720 [Lentzea sp. NBRC 105346]